MGCSGTKLQDLLPRSPDSKNKDAKRGKEANDKAALTSEQNMSFNPLEYQVPGQFVYNGVVYCSVNEGLDIHVADDWKPDPEDIMITTYPKSGTTWMAGILPLVINDGDVDKVNAMGHMTSRVPYLEVSLPGAPSYLESEKDEKKPPRLMKTHLMYEFVKKQVEEDKIKVIVVIRNPKDALVSFYHMYKSQEVLGKFPGTFHDYFELYKAKRLQYGDVFDWNKAWWEKRHLENVLVVKYEDMIKDCAGVVRQVAEFCNKDLDKSTIEKIVDKCSLKSMRNDPMVNIQTAALDMKSGNFYRKGEIGDWKNYFTEEESEVVDKHYKECFEPIGLHLDFE